MDKVKSSGAHDLVSQVVVVDTKKGESLKEICSRYSGEEVIFVDDKLEFVNEVTGNGYENLKTVLFNQNGFDNLVAEINMSRKTEGIPDLEVRENEVAGRHEPNPHVPKEIGLH
jgi:glutamine synthetase type III